MIAEFVSRPEGAYVLTFALAVAVGLVVRGRSIRAWASTVLVSGVFLAVASTRVDDAPFAAPLYIVVAATTSVIVVAVQLRGSPLLADEPWWRRFLLAMLHERAVRQAAGEDSEPVSGRAHV
ncbi:hypothetical protein ELQ92_00615 [Labedella populi]|uniref:Uncharacterized protein n=1 Tax=Labedella populi TaxID=2498850 RepID=A0A3S4BD19_9MICO|nr:hypothetical protein [Labedella populi]RWZ67811.1 hypothetical protein ELQ92_00615 [Labedella populi]